MESFFNQLTAALCKRLARLVSSMTSKYYNWSWQIEGKMNWTWLIWKQNPFKIESNQQQRIILEINARHTQYPCDAFVTSFLFSWSVYHQIIASGHAGKQRPNKKKTPKNKLSCFMHDFVTIDVCFFFHFWLCELWQRSIHQSNYSNFMLSLLL